MTRSSTSRSWRRRPRSSNAFLPPSTIRCDVAYANAFNQAVRKAPAVMSQQFGVEDGRLLFVAGPSRG